MTWSMPQGLTIHARHSMQFIYDNSSKSDCILEVTGSWRLLLCFYDYKGLTKTFCLKKLIKMKIKI